MKPQRLLLSVLVTLSLAYKVSSQGGYSSSGGYSGGGGGGGYNYNAPSQSGYSYPVPNRPLLYPGENEVSNQDSFRRGRSRVIYGTPEDNKDSDLILERSRERTSSRSSSSSGGSGGGGRVVEEEVIIRRDPSPTPERVVERVVEEQVVQRGPAQREVVEEVIYDERERDAGVTREEALNRGGNVENIQDVRDRVNNEIVREEVIEERQRFVEGEGGENGNGAIEERFVEGGGGGSETESGSSSTFTRRRTSLRGNDRRDDRRDDRRSSGSRGSSTTVRERVQSTSTRPRVIERTTIRESTRASGSTNREIANKAYGIGSGNDESISGSSTRSRLLEQSFRKDVKAPNYNNVPDDENFNVRSNSDRDINERRTSSTTIRKSVTGGSGSRSYSNIADDDEGESGNVIIRKTTTRTIINEDGASSGESERGIDSAQVIEGGTFAASQKDPVISRGSSATTSRSSSFRKSSSSGGGSYGSLGDDSDGSGSTHVVRVSSFSSGGGRRSSKDRHHSTHRHHSGDALTSASNTHSIRASASEIDRAKLPSHYRQLMTGTPDEVAAMTGATYMYTRTAPICPTGGCVLSALTSSSRGGGSEFKSAATSSFSSFRAPKNYEHL